jgi:hypothetical protein
MEPARKRIPYEERDQNIVGLSGIVTSLYSFIGCCIVPVLAIVGLVAGELIAVWWPGPGTIVLTIVLVIVSLVLIGISSALRDKDELASASYAKVVWGLATSIIVLTVVFIGVFAEFSRHVYIAFGGFTSPNQSVLTWIEFALQEWVDTVTLGISSIYGGISHVDASAWWSKTFIIAPYHLYCAAFLVIAIRRGISLSRAEARDEILGG